MDKWLVRKMIGGDQEAADKLVRKHYPGIFRFLRHLTGNADDASDLAQQSFAQFRERAVSFRGTGTLRAWLFQTAYREFLHWKRNAADTAELPEDLAAPAVRSEDSVVLTNALRELPEDLATAFWLLEVEQLSVREIASMLDIPEGTVKSRCYHARQRLRQRLGPIWGSPSELMEVDHVI